MTLPYPALPPSQTQNSLPSGSTMITQRLPCSVRVCTGSLAKLRPTKSARSSQVWVQAASPASLVNCARARW